MKLSKIGQCLGLGYLLLASLAFGMHLYSVNTNTADSGESAIAFFLLTLPWGMLIPSPWADTSWQWLSYPVHWFYVLANAGLLYIVLSLAETWLHRLWTSLIRRLKS